MTLEDKFTTIALMLLACYIGYRMGSFFRACNDAKIVREILHRKLLDVLPFDKQIKMTELLAKLLR